MKYKFREINKNITFTLSYFVVLSVFVILSLYLNYCNSQYKNNIFKLTSIKNNIFNLGKDFNEYLNFLKNKTEQFNKDEDIVNTLSKTMLIPSSIISDAFIYKDFKKLTKYGEGVYFKEDKHLTNNIKNSEKDIGFYKVNDNLYLWSKSNEIFYVIKFSYDSFLNYLDLNDSFEIHINSNNKEISFGNFLNLSITDKTSNVITSFMKSEIFYIFLIFIAIVSTVIFMLVKFKEHINSIISENRRLKLKSRKADSFKNKYFYIKELEKELNDAKNNNDRNLKDLLHFYSNSENAIEQSSAIQIQNLLEKINLNCSQIESKNIYADVTLKEILQNIVDKFSEDFREKGIMLNESFTSQECLCFINEPKLKLLLYKVIDSIANRIDSKGFFKIITKSIENKMVINIHDNGFKVSYKDIKSSSDQPKCSYLNTSWDDLLEGSKVYSISIEEDFNTNKYNITNIYVEEKIYETEKTNVINLF